MPKKVNTRSGLLSGKTYVVIGSRTKPAFGTRSGLVVVFGVPGGWWWSLTWQVVVDLRDISSEWWLQRLVEEVVAVASARGLGDWEEASAAHGGNDIGGFS
ncbi:hypothetical protein Drorol1_Dr00021534 [Drosera rotundifolia]